MGGGAVGWAFVACTCPTLCFLARANKTTHPSTCMQTTAHAPMHAPHLARQQGVEHLHGHDVGREALQPARPPPGVQLCSHPHHAAAHAHRAAARRPRPAGGPPPGRPAAVQAAGPGRCDGDADAVELLLRLADGAHDAAGGEAEGLVALEHRPRRRCCCGLGRARAHRWPAHVCLQIRGLGGHPQWSSRG